jgi:hypothetical protein
MQICRSQYRLFCSRFAFGPWLVRSCHHLVLNASACAAVSINSQYRFASIRIRVYSLLATLNALPFVNQSFPLGLASRFASLACVVSQFPLRSYHLGCSSINAFFGCLVFFLRGAFVFRGRRFSWCVTGSCNQSSSNVPSVGFSLCGNCINLSVRFDRIRVYSKSSPVSHQSHANANLSRLFCSRFAFGPWLVRSCHHLVLNAMQSKANAHCA